MFLHIQLITIPLIISLSCAMTNVFFKYISNQVIGILKGNWSLRRRQRLPLRNSSFAVTPSNSPFMGEKRHEHQRKGPDFVFGIILTHLFMTKGEEKHFEGSNDSVFGDSCQKGGEMSPKQKDRTTTKFKNLVLNIFNWFSYCVQKGEKIVF